MKRIADLDEGTLRRVDWQELIPATILIRAFPATFKASYLALGALLLSVFATLFAAGERPNALEGWIRSGAPSAEVKISNSLGPRDDAYRAAQNVVETAFGLESSNRVVPANALGSCATPPETSIGETIVRIFAFFTAFWFALGIARTAAVRLASTSRSSTIRSLKFATRNFSALFLPIFAPILFYCCAFGTVAFFRWVRGAGIVEAVGAPFSAVALFAFAILVAITTFSFPLSTAAVATEKSDGFDAVSRGVSYLTQRPLHWLAYSALAAGLSFVGFEIVVAISGAARTLYAQIGFEPTAWARFWDAFLLALPVAYLGICGVVYSTAIYFALRRSVDGTPFDAFNDDATGKKTRRLRPILQDAQGAPTFDAPKANDAETDAGKSDSETQGTPENNAPKTINND